MNATLRERLTRVEQQFLLAVVSNDEESLRDFSQEWSRLAHDIRNIKEAGALDNSTTLLLSQVSRAIENTTLCMLECGAAVLQEAQTCSISDIIQDIPTGEPSSASLQPQAPTSCHLIFSNLPSSMTPSILGQQDLLDSYAYCWLMQNIHNPYPNSVQTQIISDISGTSAAQVELWFQEVRDSIGWNRLSHDFFADSVNATVAAAQRVYLARDRDVPFDVVFAFTAVRAFAEMLFSKHPALRGRKNANTKSSSASTIRTIAADRDHHLWPLSDESTLDSEGVLVAPPINFSAPPEPFSDLSDSDESEEDTDPPPAMAGRKRPVDEDVPTAQAFDLGRPHKRRRPWSINGTSSELDSPPLLTPSSEPESPPLLPSTSDLSSDQTTPCISAAPVLPSSSSYPLFPTSLESFPGLLPSGVQEGRVELDEDKNASSLLPSHVSAHRVRKRKLSQGLSPVLSKRQCYSSVPSWRHSNLSPTSPSDARPDLSPPWGGSTIPDEVSRPPPQLPVNSDTPINLDVFDWNSISDPLAETASSMSQPAVVYVPGSNLTSQLFEPPNFGHDVNTTFTSPNDSGSLEDFSSSLQFPISLGRTPDPSTAYTVSPHSWNSLPTLQDFDWSTITEFVDLCPPDSARTSSLLASTSALPPPGNSHESLSPPQSCESSEQLLSILDPSVPPSVVLPLEPGAFPADSMWSFLHEVS